MLCWQLLLLPWLYDLCASRHRCPGLLHPTPLAYLVPTVTVWCHPDDGHPDILLLLLGRIAVLRTYRCLPPYHNNNNNNHSVRLMVQRFRFSVVLVDGLPMFQVKLEKAAFCSSGWACWFNALTQFYFTTVLLMRWQVIPANYVVFFL